MIELSINDPSDDSNTKHLVSSALFSDIVLEEDTDKSIQVLFDINGDIDPFKNSLEEPKGASIDQAGYDTAITDDIDTVSYISYRPLPTSSSLEQYRQSDTSFEEDIEDIDMDYDRDLPKTRVYLPAMETVIRNIGIAQERNRKALLEKKKSTQIKPDNNRSRSSQEMEFNMETPIDVCLYSSSLTNPQIIKDVPVNRLNPREQEEAGNYRRLKKDQLILKECYNR
jgi:hypothetical protein